jgi:hypothetical protein
LLTVAATRHRLPAQELELSEEDVEGKQLQLK